MEDRERGHLYPLLIVKDRFEPAQVLLLERHQDHECAGFVMQLRVVGSRLGVEEPHGGLVPHVVLIASHWGIIQPDKGTPAMENIRRCLTAVEIWIPANEVTERPKNRDHRLFTICQHLVQKKKNPIRNTRHTRVFEEETQMNNIWLWDWKTSSQEVKGIKCDFKFCNLPIAT